MHVPRIPITAVALLVGLLSPALTKAVHAQQGPPPGYGWDAAPQELNEFQRQGFRDGIEGARRDVDNHRPPTPENRDEFRHPRVPEEMREAYRDGFRRGYRRAMEHMTGEQGRGFGGPGGSGFSGSVGAPVPPPPPQQQWDALPNEYSDIQRRGFHDGMEGARRDFDNHRRPDVNNRDEYRHPHLPGEVREAYREGFRQGYDRATAHLMGRPSHY